ncbi:MAG: C40 family peptidase [Eubacterium sp.]|nr:C40 family peptidase [Eubacterium sp.]
MKDLAIEQQSQVTRQEGQTVHIGATAAAMDAMEQKVEEFSNALAAGEELPELLEEETPELAVAQVDSYLNVRNQPDMEGEVVGKLYRDSVGEIIGEEEGGWLKITSGSVEGYIKAEYALRGEEGAAKAEEVGVRQAKVEADALRLREEATTESGIIRLLPQEEVVQVEQELEGWLKVDAGAQQGYVSADYVDVYTVHPVAESREEEEERLRREEEERLAAEAAARAQAEAEALAKRPLQENSNAANSSAQTNRGNSGGQQKPGTGGGAQESSGLGQQIANFALQFVGNPYVYGGTSLTNGADCSGFVMSVYQNFGISLPRTSGEQGQCGTDVGGLGNAKPGDLVSYSGHIGIYIGNGQIVHASSAKTGIKVSNASYRPILSVRRIV